MSIEWCFLSYVAANPLVSVYFCGLVAARNSRDAALLMPLLAAPCLPLILCTTRVYQFTSSRMRIEIRSIRARCIPASSSSFGGKRSTKCKCTV